MRARLYLHIGLWGALFAVFLALSLPIVGPAILENKIGPIDPNHSTDSYLSGLTHVRNGSQLFSNLLETVPAKKSLVIFVDAESSPSEFLGMLVAYLAWSHDVRIVKVRGASLEQEIAAAKSSAVAGLFFCSIKPPASLTRGTHFGSAIIFVPNTAHLTSSLPRLLLHVMPAAWLAVGLALSSPRTQTETPEPKLG